MTHGLCGSQVGDGGKETSGQEPESRPECLRAGASGLCVPFRGGRRSEDAERAGRGLGTPGSASSLGSLQLRSVRVARLEIRVLRLRPGSRPEERPLLARAVLPALPCAGGGTRPALGGGLPFSQMSRRVSEKVGQSASLHPWEWRFQMPHSDPPPWDAFWLCHLTSYRRRPRPSPWR